MTQINNANNIFGAKKQHKVPENPKEALVSTQKSPSVDKVDISPKQEAPDSILLKSSLTSDDISYLLNNMTYLEDFNYDNYGIPDEYINTNQYPVAATFQSFEMAQQNMTKIIHNLNTLGKTGKVKADTIYYIMDKAAIQIIPSMIQYLKKQVAPEEQTRLQHEKKVLAENQASLNRLSPGGVSPQVAALPGPINGLVNAIATNKENIASEEEAIAATKDAIATLGSQLLDFYNKSVYISAGNSKVSTLRTEYQTVLKSLGLL